MPLPPLPDRIGRLNELAYDLWWSWNPRAREVFRELDYPLWRFTSHNPVLLLHLVEPDRLTFAATDADFLRLYDGAIADLDAVRVGRGSWWEQHGTLRGPLAWIAPQFSLHQSLPVCSTVAGVIAGDLAKEASDLGVPFIGVGLMYPRTYAHQHLTSDGAHQDSLEYVDWSDAPIRPAQTGDGSSLRLTVPVAGTEIAVAVWQVRAGRSTIYLLDTDLRGNAPWDRELSSRTHAGDPDARLRQSILLGAGAVTLFERLGIAPSGWHLSGGHALPVILERLHRLVQQGIPFADASALVRVSTVFHTASDVPAAADSYAPASVDRHLSTSWPGLTPHRAAVLALGDHETDRGNTFNASVLGARQCGAVTLADEAVHLSSWISSEMGRLIETRIGPDWRARQTDQAVWNTLLDLEDDALAGARQRLRGYLVAFMRDRARRRWAREQASGARLVALGTLMDDAALTVGCIPRFGAGGRADLLFSDVQRLARIATTSRRPVQFVLAGRVDADDEAGKHQVRRTFSHTLDPAFGGRLAFVEDYDLHVARLMAQGCDVWLTLPSGSPGASLGAVKAAVNGVPHLAPAAAIRARWTFDSSRALYEQLEESIVPAFYDRSRSGVPERWLGIVRETLADAIPRHTAHRPLEAAARQSSISRV